jgi:hypothetical protein
MSAAIVRGFAMSANPIPLATKLAIVEALAQGVETKVAIAKKHGVSTKTIERLERGEKYREQIAQARLTLRAKTAAKLETLNPMVLEKVQETLTDPNLKPLDRAKATDAYSRAAGALEKIGASVSGELIPKREQPQVGVIVNIHGDWGSQGPHPANVHVLPPVEHLSPVAETASFALEKAKQEPAP